MAQWNQKEYFVFFSKILSENSEIVSQNSEIVSQNSDYPITHSSLSNISVSSDE